MNNLVLSIITVNLNNREGLCRTIESVINQTFQDFEYIVIDGGSTDGSKDAIQGFSDHIDYWVSEPDTGIYNAMNKGIARATGEYCLFLNSGDSLIDNALSDQLFESRCEDILYFPCCMAYSSGKCVLKKYPNPISASFLFRDSLNHQSTLIKTSTLIHLDGYNEGIPLLADFDFWIRSILLENASTCYQDIAITKYDMHGRTSAWTPDLEKIRTDILRTYFPPLVYEGLFHLSQMQILFEAKERKSFSFTVSFFLFRAISRIQRTFQK